MFETKLVYEMMLFIYGLCVIGYFIDFIYTNRKVNQISFRLLSFIWTLQTAMLSYEIFILKHPPLLTKHDSLFFYAWLLITASLIINRKFKIHFFVFFTNVFSFFILLLSIALKANAHIYEQGTVFVHEILIVHVVLAIISYSFFTISFLLSLMYLMQYRLIKRKKGFKWMWQIADLQQLDKYSFITVIIGVPLLLLGIILGVVWAYVADQEFYWLDFKTLGSIFVLIIYIIYLILRLAKGYKGKPISVYNSGAFLILLVNYFLFSTYSKFHLM